MAKNRSFFDDKPYTSIGNQRMYLMSLILDRIKNQQIGEGDSVKISCRNGKTYDGCIVKLLSESQTDNSIMLELANEVLGSNTMNISLADIKIIRKMN
jgi:hypothetical protein